MIKILFILFFGISVYAQDAIELKNYGAENGVQGWVKGVAANFSTASYTNPSVQNGKKYFVYSYIGVGDATVKQLITTPTNYLSQRCSVTLNYRTSTLVPDGYEISILNVTLATNLSLFNALPATTTWASKTIEFQCPSSNDVIAIQFRDLSGFPGEQLFFDNVMFNYKRVRAFISGNISNGTANVIQSGTSYSVMQSPNLTWNVNNTLPNQGSSTLGFAARIPCQNGVASGGFNCGINDETIGVSLILPAAVYKVCFTFISAMGNSDSAESDFRIVTTTDTSTTAVVSGQNLTYINDHASNFHTMSWTLCDTFWITVQGRTVFRLFSRRIGATAVPISSAGTLNIQIEEMD